MCWRGVVGAGSLLGAEAEITLVVHMDTGGVNLARFVVKSWNLKYLINSQCQNTRTFVEHHVVPSGWGWVELQIQSAQEQWTTFILKERAKLLSNVTGAHILVFEGEDAGLAGGGSSVCNAA